ncbi:1-deoxy-D-xylulose-5-phosphate reductoisomerase [Roseospirillum parvum]|uniref:1-deoxy-D-xylulose 5-phosphate reductoisomerase n=1 Tax=Roseospirillum parvum TaxID=83401 RepID=A0A1G7Y2J1_9PROT|nr:1-deoxy-D-xylulose-5-phosphate reductoisomerase [Roseospirillum parvum]SDG90594.1 1-deoxy-D-xylulose-5-phosphate reductoisomerase [Roseospirillum parvum]
MTEADGRHGLTVLGATGSIGTSTLDLVRRNPDTFKVVALTAHSRILELAEAAREFNAELAVTSDPARYQDLKAALEGSGIEVAAGPEAVVEAARRPSARTVMAAIVGAAGLAPTLAAVARGARVALANKECLVCAGDLMTAAVADSGAVLLPVDSEHNAIFQVFDDERREGIEKIILTASGGPFRRTALEDMRAVTPEQAVAHPNWSMGAKISVDSASMMNKGLELIEAHHLFAMPESRIDILVHPQSVIHSMVAYVDGSVLAQLGCPDMRTPIAYALAWPARMKAPVERLDLGKIATLSFEAPDLVRFPALRLAREALRQGGGAPTILNAANEVAVAAFLGRRIGFLDIAAVVDATLARLDPKAPASIDEVIGLDAAARRTAEDLLGSVVAAQ